MCGIAGVSNLNENTRRVLPYLAYEMEERGDDSWGILSPDYIHKELGPVTLGWHTGADTILDMYDDGLPISIHTRAGSVGSITQENSHPFEVIGSKCTVVGMHNGCVSNWKELETKHNIKYEVDSQFICHYIANGLDTSEIRGWGAFVWLEWQNDEDGKPTGEPTLNFVRFNMTDFHIAKLFDGDRNTTLIWCSTKSALTKACRMADLGISFYYDIKDNTRYQYMKDKEAEAVIDSGFPLAVLGNMQFGYRHYNPNQNNCSVNHTVVNAAKPKGSDYEPGTNNVGKQNPTQTTDSASNATTRKFSVGDVGKELREANKCVICKSLGVDRKNRGLCDACIKDLEQLLKDSVNPNAPDNRRYLIYGLDWEYRKDGTFEFIFPDEEGNGEAFVSGAYGC